MAAGLLAAALFVAPAVAGCGSPLERPTLDGVQRQRRRIRLMRRKG